MHSEDEYIKYSMYFRGYIQKAWTGSLGSRRLRLPEFLVKRHMKVERLLGLRTGRRYPTPKDIPGRHFCRRVSLPQGRMLNVRQF